MTPVILCDRVPCTNPYAQTCAACKERLCATCYGPGYSSGRCARCYRRLAAEQAVTEERRREAASQAASW